MQHLLSLISRKDLFYFCCELLNVIQTLLQVHDHGTAGRNVERPCQWEIHWASCQNEEINVPGLQGSSLPT